MHKDEFPGFWAKEWIEYYDSLNTVVPVEKLRLELTEEQKKKYVAALEWLIEKRKIFPIASYEVKYSWFD